jgi:hypothetical protein
MEAMQPPGPDPRQDRSVTQTSRSKLGDGDHTVLPGRQVRDRPIGAGTLSAHIKG